MPIGSINNEFLAEQVLLPSQDNPAACCIDINDIARGAGASGEALALADGEQLDSVMGSQMIPLHVIEAAGLKRLSTIRKTILKESLVILPWHEADLLTILLVGHLKAEFAGDATDLLFGECAEWEQGPDELLPAQTEEEVGLVLLWIESFAEDRGAVCRVLRDG